ncbi:rhomboid family intramembrane serine protease, partial [archaeon]
MSVIFEVIGHPFCVVYIIIVAWVWVNVVVEEWDYKPFILSYEDCVIKRQYWRLLTSPLIHKSFLHLFFNLVMLWSVRWVEDEYGSWFMFRYTILLHFSEGLFAFLLIQYGIKLARNEIFRQYLSNIQSLGSSGVVIAWLTFMSTHLRTSPIIFLGVLPFHPAYALFPTILLNYLLTPLSNVYANLSGLLCGYMLAGGVLTLLPTPYLTICILGNIFLMTLLSYY